MGCDFSSDIAKNYESTGRVKPGTVRIRQKQINRLLDYFAKLKLKSITKKQYQDALIDLFKCGYAENTMDGIHVCGRMIFKQAVIDEVINRNPTDGAYVPRKPKTVEEIENEDELPKYLEKEELALFLKTAKEKGLARDYAVFMTLAYSGIRIGELCSIKWRDIDLENGTIKISKTNKNDKNNIKQYELGTPKTLSSVRQIEIGEEIINELKEHKSHQNKIKMRYRDRYYDQGYVFAEESKKYASYPTYPKKFENRMRRLLKMTTLNHVLAPHSLRHTHTSLLAEARVDLIHIKERLGHSDDDIIEKIYLHVTKDRKKETAAKFSEHMRGLF